MNINDFESIHPFVRMVKIKKSLYLQGEWEDLDHVLIYIAGGSVIYRISDHFYQLNTGDVILIPPYLCHYLFSQDSNRLVQYIFHFDLFTDPLRQKIPHQSASDMSPAPELPACEALFNNTVYVATIPSEERFQFESLFLQMYREFSKQKPGWQGMLRAMSSQMLFSFLRYVPREHLASKESLQKMTKPRKLVQGALEYIYLHYNENLENSTIAQAMDVSPNYLTKIFRQHVGIPLHKYVTSYRLEQAQQMLASGKYNITEIAQKYGFSSIHMFSKVFKQECGITPSAYLALPTEDRNEQIGKADYNTNRQTFYNV